MSERPDITRITNDHNPMMCGCCMACSVATPHGQGMHTKYPCDTTTMLVYAALLLAENARLAAEVAQLRKDGMLEHLKSTLPEYSKGYDRGFDQGYERASTDVAALRAELAAAREWQSSVSNALRSWEMFGAGEWGGDRDGWGYHVELIGFLIRHYEVSRVVVDATKEWRATLDLSIQTSVRAVERLRSAIDNAAPASGRGEPSPADRVFQGKEHFADCAPFQNGPLTTCTCVLKVVAAVEESETRS